MTPPRRTAICDLERMQALADFLGAQETSEDIRTLRSQIPSQKSESTLFRSTSGGFAQLSDLLGTAAEAFQDRLTRLVGSDFGPIPANLDGIMLLMADREFLARHLIDGSQDRLEQCLILARMGGVISAMQRIRMTSSVQAGSADAQRILQLASGLGIPNLRPHGGTFVPSFTTPTTPPIEPESPEGDEAVPQVEDSTGSQPVAEESDSNNSRNLVLNIEVTDREPQPPADPAPPAVSSGVGAAPPADPPPPGPQADTITEESEEGPPQTSGVGRLLAAIISVVLAGALVVYFTYGNPFQGNNELNFIEALQSRLAGMEQPAPGVEVVDPATVAAEPDPTEATVPTSTPLPSATASPAPVATFTPTPSPTSTPTPEPTPLPIPDSVAYTTQVLRKFEWPHLQAEPVGEDLEAGSALVLIRKMEAAPESEQVWLQLLDGTFVKGDSIRNIPDNLPVVDPVALGMPDFEAVEQEPELEETASSTPTALPEIILRAGPGEQYDEKGRLPGDAQLDPIGTNAQRDWVVLDTRFWIPVSRVANLPDDLPVILAPYAAITANLREGPSAATAAVGTVAEGQTMVLVAQTQGTNPEGIWYRLDYGPWIYGGLVEDLPAGLPAE